MKPSKASYDRLRSMIRSAFDDIECPAAEAVVAWNRVEIAEEAENVRVHLVGTRWQDVSPHDLRFGEDRFLLTTDAYRYYFPAFLLAALDEEADLVVDGIVDDLTRPSGEGPRLAWFQSVFSFFTGEQACAVYEFLRLIENQEAGNITDEAARDARARYWDGKCGAT